VESQAIQFNTGRGYTPEGQIINAMVVEIVPDTDPDAVFVGVTYKAVFYDKSRHISGEISFWMPDGDGRFNLREEVMRKYDHNQYEYSFRAAEFERSFRK
jgi:hypothetical protein